MLGHDVQNHPGPQERGSSTHSEKPAHKRRNPRPQRLHTWFNLIPVDQAEQQRPDRVLFLDSFVTLERQERGSEVHYVVRFEGLQEMTVVVDVGVIFVWYGEDLQSPDRPFPTLYAEQYPSRYISSAATIFEDTHVMDFVENGSDNLHFNAVHLWEYSKIYDHEVTEENVTLKQDTRFRYGLCSTNPLIRLMSRVLPKLELTQDYVYHGPALAVVGARGKGSPRMHALVSLTPEGDYRTRVHVTMAIHPETFPSWAEQAFQRLLPDRTLADALAGVMANYIKNEFDIDAVIWANRKHLPTPALLPSERHLAAVMRWCKSFYPPGFEAPREASKARRDPYWRDLETPENITAGKVHRYTVGDTELIAHRDAQGQLKVFDAFCPHQGAHLGHGGKLQDDCLRCPFHGLHFNADGKCISTDPDARGTPIKSLELRPIEHRQRGGRVQVRV